MYADRNSGRFEPHLGSDYLISLLLQNGYDAERITTNTNEMLVEKIKTIRTKYKNETLIFGYTCYDANYQMVKSAIKITKRIIENSIIFIGGPSATFNDEVILNSIDCIDICLLGESEKSILEFIQCVANGKPYNNIQNTSFIKDGIYKKIGNNCILSTSDINMYPSAICSNNYNAYDVLNRYGKISIITSRGCPYKCSFCAFSLQSGHKVRYYNPDRVIDEIKIINESLSSIKDTSVKKVVFEDDCFTLNKNHFNNIVNKIIELKPDLIFECETRADYLTKAMLKKMKKAGFYRVDISLESSEPLVLLKNQKVKSMAAAKNYIISVKNVVKWCKELSIECYTTLMCGLPFDEKDSVLKTYAFIKNIEPTGYYWNNLKVFTGTKLFKDYFIKLVKKNDENIFNPIFCNEITYNNISNYNPNSINRIGDDVSWASHYRNSWIDLIHYSTNITNSEQIIIGVSSSFNFKKYINKLIESVPYDTKLLVFSEKNNNIIINSIRLSELMSVAMFESNTNKKIYTALLHLSPPIMISKDKVNITDGLVKITNNGELNINGTCFKIGTSFTKIKETIDSVTSIKNTNTFFKLLEEINK